LLFGLLKCQHNAQWPVVELQVVADHALSVRMAETGQGAGLQRRMLERPFLADCSPIGRAWFQEDENITPAV
jgi:hypothetical protein